MISTGVSPGHILWVAAWGATGWLSYEAFPLALYYWEVLMEQKPIRRWNLTFPRLPSLSGQMGARLTTWIPLRNHLPHRTIEERSIPLGRKMDRQIESMSVELMTRWEGLGPPER